MFLLLFPMKIPHPVFVSTPTTNSAAQHSITVPGTKYPVLYRQITRVERLRKDAQNIKYSLSELAEIPNTRGTVSSGAITLVLSSSVLPLLSSSSLSTVSPPILCCRRGLKQSPLQVFS